MGNPRRRALDAGRVEHDALGLSTLVGQRVAAAGGGAGVSHGVSPLSASPDGLKRRGESGRLALPPGPSSAVHYSMRSPMRCQRVLSLNNRTQVRGFKSSPQLPCQSQDQ